MSQNNSYGNLNTRRRRKHRHKKQKLFLMAVIAVVITTIIGSTQILKASENSTNTKTNSSITPEEQTSPIDKTDSSSTVETQEESVTESESNKDIDKESVTESESNENIDKESVAESENNENIDKESDIEVGYDYTKPVPKSEVVGNDYFDDTVFIGDSRTEGMILNTGLSNAILYTNKGLMVDTVFTKPVINKDGEKLSVMEALRRTDFSKVYIMLGINETGWAYSEVFAKKYGEIIDEIKNINPQAIIYVQEILPVSDSVSKTHSYVKNEKINEYNTLIREMAEEKQIYFIDVANAVSDANGCLPEEAAFDGIHLKKSYCEKWLEYIKAHTVTEVER